METIVGIFNSRVDGERAAKELRTAGIPEDKIVLLAPGASEGQLGEVPTTEAEQPGMGKALGATVGGALGVAGGVPLGAALASFFIPGVGPVIAAGLLGAAILGMGGAATGAAAGGALEGGLAHGLPHDELYLYQDALRRGRSVVIAFAEDDETAERGRGALVRTGAESIDAARESWWIGLRSAEEERYTGEGKDFTRDERTYRRGFEAALHPSLRGKAYDEALKTMKEAEDEEVFRSGYERGQDYHRSLKDKYRE
ncbi:MAG: hypothetical protein ABJC05_07180 [Pyrinomonadaceae bacterium]